MQYIPVAAFPKPTNYRMEVTVGPASCRTNTLVFTFSMLLAGLATYQGAISPWKLNWWQWLISAIFFVVVSLVIHEFAHLIAHPNFGMSRDSKFGAGRVFRVPALWVGYAGWVSRKRAIFINLLPFFALVIIAPVIGICLCTEASSFLFFVGGANLVASRKDIVNAACIAKSRSAEIYESEKGYFEK